MVGDNLDVTSGLMADVGCSEDPATVAEAAAEVVVEIVAAAAAEVASEAVAGAVMSVGVVGDG